MTSLRARLRGTEEREEGREQRKNELKERLPETRTYKQEQLERLRESIGRDDENPPAGARGLEVCVRSARRTRADRRQDPPRSTARASPPSACVSWT